MNLGPFVTVLLGLGCELSLPAGAAAQVASRGTVSDVRFDQKLGAQLPLDRRFRDDDGTERTLAELFGRRVVIVAPVYYGCPMLCNQLLNGLTRSLKPLGLAAGKDFDVVAFSINPGETPDLAAKKKAAYLERDDRSGAESGWHFLTADEPAIGALAQAIGFRFTYNPATKLYAHAAGIVIVTPEGRIARISTGSTFRPRSSSASSYRHARGTSARPSLGFSCCATTTTRRPANTRSRSFGSFASWEPRRPPGSAAFSL